MTLGRGETREPTRDEATASTTPWISWLAVFKPEPPTGERTLGLVPIGAPQPQVVTVDGATAFFDGRLYERSGLLQRSALGALSPNASDGEVLLKGFLLHGLKVFAQARGGFGCVIWLEKQRSIICVRDPLGVFPLFWAEAGPEIFVSPSQDTLLRYAGVPKQLNRVAIAEWAMNAVQELGPTFFTAVQRVPPGHALSLGRRNEMLPYWHPENASPDVPTSVDEAHDVFDDRVSTAVKRCLYLAPASVFLSGGLDSALVTAVAAAISRETGRRPPTALSVTFPDPAANEEPAQRGIAAALGLRQVMRSAESAGAEGVLVPVLRLAGRDPLPSTAPWQLVYEELASHAFHEGCKSILTGDGGNELLDARSQLAADLIRRGHVAGLARLYRVGRSYYGGSRRALVRKIFWRSGLRVLLRETLGTSARYGYAPAYERRLHRRYAAVIRDGMLVDRALRAEIVARMVASHPAPSMRPFYPRLRRLLFADPALGLTLESNFIWGQIVGLPTLSPLIDVDVVEYLYHLPPTFLSFRGRGKGLARASVERRADPARLPQFAAVSFEGYFKGLMQREASRAFNELGGLRLLEDLGVVQGQAVEKAFRDGFQGTRIGYSQVWVLLGLEAWLRSRV
jgi:asparagine synthase (glutamine-hydrolysing)